MDRTPFLRRVSPAAIVLLIATLAPAQNSSALIGEALDKQVDLELKGPLPEAMREITKRTSVPLRAEAGVWELLPWGEQTSVTATVKNQTLRQSLGALTQKLGLTFTLGDEAVILQPLPALRRLGRRSTVQELQALDRLAAELMPPVQGASTVNSILSAIDDQLEAKGTPFAIENGVPPAVREAAVEVPRNASMLEALEQVARQTPATWYPWGKSLVVVPKETQVADQLAKTLTKRYIGADIMQVLEDLRQRAGVDFMIEPGAIQRIPPEFRSVVVIWDNVPVAQALRSLSGFTGLQYAVTDRGVSITNPLPATGGGGGGGWGGSNDPVVFTMQLENGATVGVRTSQVSPEVRAYLKSRVDKQLDALREAARREGFVAPATQPATAPATR